MCLSKIIIIIICWPLLRLVILFRDANNFFREESISLEIIISFSLQGQVKKTKLQEAFFSTCTCWRIFCILEQPDENANSKPEWLRLKRGHQCERSQDRTRNRLSQQQDGKGPYCACHSQALCSFSPPHLIWCQTRPAAGGWTPKRPAETHASQRTQVCEPRLFASLYKQHQSEKIIVLFWEHRGNETWKNMLNRQRLDKTMAMKQKKASNCRQVQ